MMIPNFEGFSMSSVLRVFVSGEAPVKFTSSKNGKEYTITNVYVKGRKPFPEQVGLMQNVKLPAGAYDVPYVVSVFSNRLQVDLDFEKAVLVKDL